MAPADLAVEVEPTSDGWVATVTVHDAVAATRHHVRILRQSLERLGPHRTPEDLLRASFEFLLEREPSSSILGEFEIDDIARYFPEYPAEIAARLGTVTATDERRRWSDKLAS